MIGNVEQEPDGQELWESVEWVKIPPLHGYLLWLDATPAGHLKIYRACLRQTRTQLWKMIEASIPEQNMGGTLNATMAPLPKRIVEIIEIESEKIENSLWDHL